ncbi:MAG: hypothetical protein QF682_06565 [Candidatus Thermoplasmatota archaeon]|nr:hypothetical protein [Candidatus Thermoplasmatota archaeon]MDP7421769.1 hypothetical protein [bacterium]
MLVFKIETRLFQDLFKGIPVLDEFCIVIAEGGCLKVFTKNLESTVAVLGSIKGGMFDYLVSNNISFAVNLVKVKRFLKVVDHSYPLIAELNEDRFFISLRCGPLSREIKCLYPDNVELEPILFPEMGRLVWLTGQKEFYLITQGLEQADYRSSVILENEKIIFRARSPTDMFTFTSEHGIGTPENFTVNIMTRDLASIVDHIAPGHQCNLSIRENSPLMLENVIRSKCNILYLIAHELTE